MCLTKSEHPFESWLLEDGGREFALQQSPLLPNYPKTRFINKAGRATPWGNPKHHILLL